MNGLSDYESGAQDMKRCNKCGMIEPCSSAMCVPLPQPEPAESEASAGDVDTDPLWMRLRAYRIDGVDVYLATDMEDLAEAIKEHTGCTWEDETGNSLTKDATVEVLELSQVLTIQDDAPSGGPRHTQTVGQWIVHMGRRGLLCSTEW